MWMQVEQEVCALGQGIKKMPINQSTALSLNFLWQKNMGTLNWVCLVHATQGSHGRKRCGEWTERRSQTKVNSKRTVIVWAPAGVCHLMLRVPRELAARGPRLACNHAEPCLCTPGWCYCGDVLLLSDENQASLWWVSVVLWHRHFCIFKWSHT